MDFNSIKWVAHLHQEFFPVIFKTNGQMSTICLRQPKNTIKNDLSPIRLAISQKTTIRYVGREQIGDSGNVNQYIYCGKQHRDSLPFHDIASLLLDKYSKE